MKTGDEINYWTYIRKSKKKYYGFFRCKCGTEKELRIRNVKNEWSKSCSCIVRDKTDQNYIGKRYGRLVILDTIRKNNEITHFHCRCDCGKETDASKVGVLTGKTISCGCYRIEIGKQNADFLNSETVKNVKKYSYKGTSIPSLNQKVSKNSTTGVKGVSQMENGKYRAYINVKRKQINLGTYDELEDAKKARLEAEEKYYKPIKEDWEKERNKR